jgi:Cytochrome P450
MQKPARKQGRNVGVARITGGFCDVGSIALAYARAFAKIGFCNDPLRWHNRRQMKAKREMSNLPPSVPADWIGGHFRQFRRDPTGFLTKLASVGDVAYFRMAHQPAYFLNDPEMIRDLLVVNAHKFHKGRALKRAKALLGEGLLTNEGSSHLRQRRMIQPAFHRHRIAEYARSMVEYGEKTANQWSDGEVRDISKEMMHLTLQIVGKTLFSADVENEADQVGQAMTTIVELFNFLLLPFSDWLRKMPLPQSRRFRHARDTLDSIIYGMINDRRKTGEDKGDLLSMLLAARDEDDGSAMSDEQIRDEALTLFLAGHETLQMP